MKERDKERKEERKWILNVKFKKKNMRKIIFEKSYFLLRVVTGFERKEEEKK